MNLNCCFLAGDAILLEQAAISWRYAHGLGKKCSESKDGSGMKLRLKVLVILASIWTLIACVIYLYSTQTLLDDYAKLERQEVIDDIERARNTLSTMMSSLDVLTKDWAQWDDLYLFMQNKNRAFIHSNLTFPTFESAKINLILFFNTSGKLFYGLNYDLGQKKFISLPDDLILRLERSFNDLASQSKEISIWRTQKDYVILSAQPILNSLAKGPSQGVLVMGLYFNDHHIQTLANILKVKIDLLPLPNETSSASLQHVFLNLKNAGSYYITAPNNNLINGYTFITNIQNEPIGILHIELPRTLYHEGIKTIHRYLIILIGIGIFFMLVIWVLLKIFVLDRLINVSRQVVDIASENKFNSRIHISGKDELADMGSAINSLMEIIALTQEQLKYRIFLRTEELERLSKLNKNLYTEMSQQREVEVKLREGEKVLRQMAYYDALTGLPNRLLFNDMLEKLLQRAEKKGTHFAILFVDADKFKSINDTFGHAMGDQFLRHVASLLKSAMKETDFAARIAGDEFIICLPNVSNKEMVIPIVERILTILSQPVTLEEKIIQTSFSVGISLYPYDGPTVETLEKHADLAMYFAKKAPGNTYRFFDEIKNASLT
jgi:diguanylate cyclase (GGDEF)-like protein